MRGPGRRQDHLYVPTDGGGGGDFPPDDGSEYVITDIDETDVITNNNSWVYTDNEDPDSLFLLTIGGDTIQTLLGLDVVTEDIVPPDPGEDTYLLSILGDTIRTLGGDDVITEDLPIGANSYILSLGGDQVAGLSGDLIVWE